MFTLKFKQVFSYLIIKIFNWINLQSNIKKPGNKETNKVSFDIIFKKMNLIELH